jgi:hypothetical protein
MISMARPMLADAEFVLKQNKAVVMKSIPVLVVTKHV